MLWHSRCVRVVSSGLQGVCLETDVTLLKALAVNLPMHIQQELCDTWLRHMTLIRQIDVTLYTPKHHLMIHVLHRADLQGNPWFYHTFLDESMNKELKKVLRLCHQSTFETTGLYKVSRHLENVAKRLRRS